MQRSASQPGRTGSGLASAGAAGLRPAVSFVESIGPAGDAFEREADRLAEAVVRGDLSGGRGWATASGPPAVSVSSRIDAPAIQRKCAECEEEEEEQIRRAPRDGAAPEAANPRVEPAPAVEAASPGRPGEAATAPVAAEPAVTPAVAASPLLVEDDSEPGRGQMRKGAFLAGLRRAVCAAVDEALSGSGRDSAGCPWIDHWIGYYEARPAADIERALQRYAPEGRGGAAAAEYIPAVVARVRRSAAIFAATGAVTGVPAAGPGGAMAGGDVVGAFGGMFFKARQGGPRSGDPRSVRRQLGNGQALPGPVRARMESAFGASFGGVRIHVDATAARLSDRLNARAFTIGRDVAFGGGEFRPGTIAGDALIAHELAHVVQQRGAGPAATPAGEARLERDADAAAAGALWRSSRVGGVVGPRLRSGLALQRCSPKPSPAIDLKALKPAELDAFVTGRFEKGERKEARAILDDLLASADDLRFADLEELSAEIHKRLSTARLMKQTQDLYGKAFEYPNHAPAKKCIGGKVNPRVNKAAERYWGPPQNPEGSYYFDLSAEGKKDPYQALVTLFTRQKSICDMTLIHCDYLISVVHFRAFAERIGAVEFNKRVAAGEISMRLRYDGFVGIQEPAAPDKKGVSLRRVRPTSEKDLVIGDHVVFFNHRAYDAINVTIRNAWRLENAILIEQKKGEDIFLGHGSGRKNTRQMREKLAEEFNDVVKLAMAVVKKIGRGGSAAAAARAEMATKFPNVKETAAGPWQIETARRRTFPVDTIKASDPDLTGLRDPDDPSKMYPVERPVESE